MKYSNIITLLFHLSWLIPFIGVQAMRGAYRHFAFYIECAACGMLVSECSREILILCWHINTQPTPLRVWVYGAEHVLLGMAIMEALHYVEICRKHRKRSRRID